MLNRSGLSFTSNIRFVSNNEFNEVTKYQERSDANKSYIGRPWGRVIKSQEGLTDSIQGCVGGGIKGLNGEDAVFFHIVSAPSYSEDVDEKFAPDILNKIKGLGEKLNGLLIGGQTAKSGSFSSGFSQGLSSKLEDLYTDIKVSFSKFIGQGTRGANTNLYYSGSEDTWYVNYKDSEKPYDANMITNQEDIKEAYFDIDIAHNDHVYIGLDSYKEVDKLDLAHEFKRIDGGYELDYSYRSPYEQAEYGYTSPVDNSKKVGIYLGDYGHDRGVLWVNSAKQQDIEAVMNRISTIKLGSMFKDIQSVRYFDGQKIIKKRLS